MAATVEIHEFNGAGGTETDKTSGTVRFKNADNATVDLVNPLVKPSSGQEYSYEKWLALVASGEYTQISNVQAYSDGTNSLGTGRKVWYEVAGSYRTPVIPSESADPPQTDVNGSPLENMSDFFGTSSGSPIDMDATIGTSTPLSPNADEQRVSDFLTMVFEVETTASGGLTPTEDVTFSWDEI